MATSLVTRPCYITRDEVIRALDNAPAMRSMRAIDRKIVAASETADSVCQRVFYPEDATRHFDWPNYQYTYPWKLYLDRSELAGQPTLFTSGSLLTSPVVIPSNNYLLQPYDIGPPFTWIELRRDLSSSFGNNPTPQQDIAITGSFGYWLKTAPAGSLAVAVNASQTTVQVSAGPTVGPGVGDVMVVDSERMLVQDVTFVDTTIIPTSGGSSQQKSDVILVVPDGTKFSVGEVILIDSEWMLIEAIYGNNLQVQRAYAGSLLVGHNDSSIWANRLLTVQRGSLGTTAASHLINAAASVTIAPGLIRDFTMATALIGSVNEPSAYSVQTTASWYGSNARMNGVNREAAAGVGYQGLIAMLEQSIYVRKARSRVVLWASGSAWTSAGLSPGARLR